MNRLNRFRDLNGSQKTEIRVSPNSQRLRGHAILAFGKPPFSYFQNVAIGYVKKTKYFILADCSLYVSERRNHA